ncbi:succinylglutamate desuccinylase/aspartoacylase family protein [Ideonella sp. DXS22W]|uniref:Succinylglutamate desuccinylase/aspartoacylase family protein n=1 Tax=Pseudaquabacterium inlustre TaxID=2984192 RepID=A0ABU9CMX0_9BURK
MQTVHHPLPSATPGTTRSLTSLHFGTPGSGPKALIQASLHADEVPGMLVAHHLRQRLAALEAAGRLRGEVVLVPAANPIGLGQWTLRSHQGRFEQTSGENFNRAYADLAPAVVDRVTGRLGTDATQNVATVRAALREAVAALPAASELQALRRALFSLAVDADWVLDLHCDGEGLLHFYTTPACWPGLQPLARCLGAEPVLLAEHSGGEPFDEACSMPWAHLAAQFPAHPIPQACLAVTVELRGEGDVSHALAAQDAAGIEQALALGGWMDGPVAEPPPLRCAATPLAGSMPLIAPHGGVIVFVRAPGERVKQGDTIAELIDPFTGALTPLQSPVDGLFFARENRRFAVAGMSVGKVAGTQAQRAGALLSP